MKILVTKADPFLLKEQFPLQGLFQDWYFRVNEVSAGVYLAEGTDLWGRKVSHQGTDPKELIAQCVTSAQAITA